jgi:hypothetical protein
MELVERFEHGLEEEEDTSPSLSPTAGASTAAAQLDRTSMYDDQEGDPIQMGSSRSKRILVDDSDDQQEGMKGGSKRPLIHCCRSIH